MGAAGAVHGDAIRARVGGVCVRPAPVAAAATAAAVHARAALALEHGRGPRPREAPSYPGLTLQGSFPSRERPLHPL